MKFNSGFIFLLFAILISIVAVYGEDEIDCTLVDCRDQTVESCGGMKPIKQGCCFVCPKANCATIRCLPPKCPRNHEMYTAPNKCCPSCRPCPIIDCMQGYVPYTPSTGGCQRCKQDCRLVRCAMPVCADGQEPTKAENECCYKCPELNCSTVLCALPVCNADETPYTPEGTCCPICRSCPIVDCLPGYVPYTPAEGGCQRCGQDCRLVRCAMPVCADGQEPTKAEDECCYKCPELNCSAVQCLRPSCKDNEELYTAEGQCCPICRTKPQ